MYEAGYRPEGDTAPIRPSQSAQATTSQAPLPKYAANINLERLDTADDVKRAIADYADEHRDEFAAQGRGTQPLQTTQQIADQMVRDGIIEPKHVAAVTKGTAWNAEHLNAARSIALDLAQKAQTAAAAAQASGKDDDLAEAAAAISRFGAVQKAVGGLTSEAGRALSSLRIAARAAASKSNVEKALDALGGRKLTEEAARRLAAIPEGDTIGLARFLRSQDKWTTPEKLQAWWTASLLSAPQTMTAKMVGEPRKKFPW